MADNDTTTTFGGTSDTPCFALLDGRVTDPDTNETFTFRVPLTKLPAVLGRSHETEDPNFFGLGRRKALSRKQCVIYYQDHLGGSVEWDKVGLSYKKEGSWNFKNTKMKTPQDELPQQGFFVIECLGRNSITVNRKKLEQGESMVLESGSPIRISQHRLYFLLPTDAPPRKELIQQEGENSSTSPTKTKKGIKRPSLPSGSSTASPSTSASKKQKGTGLAAYTESLETMTTQELLDEMTSAIAANTWDRKNQMVGTVLVHRAVKDAAKAPEIMELAKDNGVARSRVIDWIEKSSRYKNFVQQLQSKIEPRSYQAAITKAVLKAGYTRNGTAGRYVKWHLPPSSDDEGDGGGAASGGGGSDDDEEEEEDEENEENEEEDDDDEEDEAGDGDNDVDETENNEDDEEDEEDEEQSEMKSEQPEEEEEEEEEEDVDNSRDVDDDEEDDADKDEEKVDEKVNKGKYKVDEKDRDGKVRDPIVLAKMRAGKMKAT